MTNHRSPITDLGLPTTDHRPLTTVFWDVDDVLNDLMKEWLDFYRLTSGIKMDYDQLTANPPHKLFGISIKKHA